MNAQHLISFEIVGRVTHEVIDDEQALVLYKGKYSIGIRLLWVLLLILHCLLISIS